MMDLTRNPNNSSEFANFVTDIKHSFTFAQRELQDNEILSVLRGLFRILAISETGQTEPWCPPDITSHLIPPSAHHLLSGLPPPALYRQPPPPTPTSVQEQADPRFWEAV
jgi:hypothetical protein